MGKKRHASLNSRIRSTGKRLKKKKEKCCRRIRDKNVDEISRNCDQDDADKKTLWSKWVGFFRLFKRDKKDSSDDLNSSKKGSSANIPSAVSSMDLIEIPREPRHRLSQIRIKPPKRGVKITECEKPSLMPLRVEERVSVIESERENEEDVEISRRRWSWDTEIVKNEARMREDAGHPLTPVLCVRREMNADAVFVESPTNTDANSAVFVETPTNTSNECIETNKTQHSKTIQINQREITYSLIEKDTGSSRKTFKSMSEPTWDEKNKMFQRKKLHENLNELLEQFMFLEEADVINFSGFQSKGVLGNRRTSLCGQSSFISEGRREPFLKLSRKVSPEILVNIKPFKEYLSGTLLGETPANLTSAEELIPTERSSEENEKSEEIEKPIISEKNFKPTKGEKKEEVKEKKKKEEGKEKKQKEKKQKEEGKEKKQKEEGKEKKQKEEGKEKKPKEEGKEKNPKEEVKGKKKERDEEESGEADVKYHCPVIRSKVHFADEYPVKSREGTTASEGVESGLPCHGVFRSSESDSGICAVFGVYKAYKGPEGAVPRREPLRNASLEEVLENLDDKDHDLIFKKNMTQFKRKINGKQRFDKRKTGPITETFKKIEVENKKMRKQDIKIQIFDSIPEIESITVTEKVSRKRGLLSVQDVGSELQRPKILGRFSPMASEASVMISRTMDYRVETSALLPAHKTLTFGDRYDAAGRTEYLLTREQPQNDGAVPLVEHLDSIFGFDPVKNLNGMAKFMSFGKTPFLNRLFCERSVLERRMEVAGSSGFSIPKYFSKPTECFYVLENYTFTSFDKESGPKLEQKLSKEISHEGAVETPEKGVTESTMITSTWTFTPQPEEGQKAIQILIGASCEVAISIENSPAPAKRGEKNLSDTAVGRKVEEKMPTLVLSSQVLTKKAEPGSEPEKGTPEKEKRTLDGFEVIFDGVDKKDPKDESTKTLKATSKESDFFFCEAPTLGWEGDEPRKKSVDFPKVCRLEIFESGDEKSSVKLLKFKSNSSPRESIVHADCGAQEQHRQRRPLNFSKEKIDSQKKLRGSAHSNKEILSAFRNSDKEDEMGAVGSGPIECRSAKPEGSFFGCPDLGRNPAEETESPSGPRGPEGRARPAEERRALAVRLAGKRVSEGARERKVFAQEKSGANVGREVLAAVQYIKERPPFKEEAGGGGERTVLVIMLSKK